MKQTTIALFLLLVLRPVFACDTPHGQSVATPQTVTACEYLDAALGLNEQASLGIYAWSFVGFGLSGGAVTASPTTLNGGYTALPQTVDGLVAAPSVATDGTDFLLVEYSSGATATRIMHADGSFGPRNVIIAASNANDAGSTINNNGGSAAVVWDGNEYIVLTTEFVRPAPDVAAVPKVVSATVRRDGSLASIGVIADNAVLLTAVRAGSSAEAIWRRNGALEAGPALPQQINTASYITLPASDAALAAAANNGSSIVVAFATSSGVNIITADTNFNNRNLRTVSAIQATGLEVAPDGNDFLVLQSDASLTARATRISGGNPGSSFALTNGLVVTAASNSRGTIVMSTHGCGTIASQFIARGATTASAPTDLTLKAAAQTDARLVATNAGHQLTYLENHALYTQFVDNNGNPQARTQLTSYATTYDTVSLNGGSAIAWVDGASATALKVARFDQNGAKRGGTIDVPAATLTINSVSTASSGDALLVAFQGTPPASHHPEVVATVIDATGTPAPSTLLSGPSDDGSNLTTGVNGTNWMIAWRNGPPHVLVVVQTPLNNLASPTTRTLPLTTFGLPTLAAADSGNVYWIERSDANYLHKIVVSSGADSVLAHADNIDTVRIVDGIPSWSVRGSTSGETTSVFMTPFGQLGCFTAFDSAVQYDTRGPALAMYVYSDGTQLHTEVPSSNTPPSRRRAVKH